MAAEMKVTLLGELTGLGKSEEFPELFVTTTTPTSKAKIYQLQTTDQAAEALSLGDVTTVHLIVIKAVTNHTQIDTSFSAAFHSEIDLQEGEVAVFKPSGTVYINNVDSGKKFTVEALVIGV
jgi:hypothetical protein